MNKRLTFYIGADPTGDSLHLSHAKNFMLLEGFCENIIDKRYGQKKCIELGTADITNYKF